MFSLVLRCCASLNNKQKSGTRHLLKQGRKIKFCCIFYVPGYKYRAAFGQGILLQTIGVTALYSVFRNMKVVADGCLSTHLDLHSQCRKYHVTQNFMANFI